VIAEAVGHIDTLIGKPGKPNMFQPLCAALKVYEDEKSTSEGRIFFITSG
jgi:hypothetical protein